MIFCETNYEFDTRVEVQQVSGGDNLIRVKFTAIGLGVIGVRRYCPSAEREAVAYAKKLIAGEVCKGDFINI